MKNLNVTRSGRKYWFLSSIGLAFLFLLALLCGLQELTPAHADSGTLYVDGVTGNDDGACGTIGAPCKTISYTLNTRASDGDTIFITGGTYTENLTVGDGISLTLRGGYSVSGTVWLPGTAETVIDGSGTISQPVVTIGNGNATVVLDSLTLTGGRAPGAGGVRAGDANVTIHNCVIRDNTAVGDGSGGGAMGPYTRWTIVDSLIIGNRIESAGGPGETGGAGGVRAGPFSPLTMVNTLVANNQGDAGIHVNSSLTLLNVTVADNDGDIIFNPATTATLAITNSIVYSQFVFLTGCPVGSVCRVNYSDVEGWTDGGTGNIQADPLFIGAGNYHLRVGSPCIDKGTPMGAPVTDIEGTPRDNAPDMGAYEWKGFRIYVPLILKQ
jgi:hypothetical protein